METNEWVTAFAPASVGNAIVGYDILGFSFDVLGDEVRVRKRVDSEININLIDGVVTALPLDCERNTAARAILSLQKTVNPGFGFDLEIRKGIPLGSGLGGSAASAVAAVVAANELLPEPLGRECLLPFAVEGEVASSGCSHADNVAPSLLGGMQLVTCENPLRSIKIPFPDSILCALIHPHFTLETRAAREVLKKEVSLEKSVEQSSNIASFITACFTKDRNLLRKSLDDVLIEPQRSILIPGFNKVKRAALDAGALGFSISGAGPSVFGFFEERDSAMKVVEMAIAIFRQNGLTSSHFLDRIDPAGARVVCHTPSIF